MRKIVYPSVFALAFATAFYVGSAASTPTKLSSAFQQPSPTGFPLGASLPESAAIPVSSAMQDETQATNIRPELGKVNWIRDFDEAIQKSKDTDKPVFVLFQEVPG